MEVSLSSPLAVRRQRCRDRLLISAAVLLVVAALVGCSDEDEPLGPGPLEPVGSVGEESGIPGSGNVVSETRDVGAFTAIVFDSEGTVVVTTGEEASLVVEADDQDSVVAHRGLTGGGCRTPTRAPSPTTWH